MANEVRPCIATIHPATRGTMLRHVRVLTFQCGFLDCGKLNGVPLDEDELDVTEARCSYCRRENYFDEVNEDGDANA